MSHFTVMVTGEEYEDAEKMLAPYQENNMGDCPEEFMEWVDETDQIKRDYVEGRTDMIRGPEGRIQRGLQRCGRVCKRYVRHEMG